MAKLRVAHIVPYIGDEASGPAYSVPALCSALQSNGCDITLYTLKPLPIKTYNFKIKGFKRQAFPIRSFGRSREMYNALMKDAANYDLIHNHSFWMAPNIYAGLVSKCKNIPLVNAPRGTMSKEALSRSRWKKTLVKLLGQKKAIYQTDAFHTTAKHESDDVKRLYPNTPIIQHSNGIDIPVLEDFDFISNSKKLLFLGRIHPIKGIENLIEAWANIENEFTDWHLDIVGKGNSNYIKELQRKIDSLSLKRILIKKPLFGNTKMTAYQRADLYILPSFSENFGVTVAESLANNTPVITTNGTPWLELANNNAGWCIDVGVRPIEEILKIALNISKTELFEMGLNGRKWMKRDFSWDSIAKDMIKAYNSLIYKNHK